jgi:hypothetical protein
MTDLTSNRNSYHKLLIHSFSIGSGSIVLTPKGSVPEFRLRRLNIIGPPDT